jgi:hypothetical protein
MGWAIARPAGPVATGVVVLVELVLAMDCTMVSIGSLFQP